MPTQVFILQGTTTWTVPTDWNSANNTIEAIGAGAAGGNGTLAGGGGGGGGGGEYRKIQNASYTPGNVITCQVGLGGTSQGAGTSTFLKDDSNSTNAILANGGSATTGTRNKTGGLGGTGGTGAAAHADGGPGGTVSSTYSCTAGGGGAGGPNGTGGTGGAGTNSSGSSGGSGGGGNGGGSIGVAATTSTGGNGGDNSASTGHGTGGSAGTAGGDGTVGGGGGGGGGYPGSGNPSAKGGKGGTGTAFDSTHGSGGGGGGGGASTSYTPGNGGDGGLYGGGGGGGGASSTATGTGGAGANGILVITYTPTSDTTPPVPASATTSTDGSKVVLQLTETGSPPVLPASGITGFSLSGTTATIASVSRTADTEITLTLSGWIISTDSPLLSYSSVTGNVTDSAASPNAMATFSNFTVTASVLPRLPAANEIVPGTTAFGSWTCAVERVVGAGGPRAAARWLSIPFQAVMETPQVSSIESNTFKCAVLCTSKAKINRVEFSCNGGVVCSVNTPIKEKYPNYDADVTALTAGSAGPWYAGIYVAQLPAVFAAASGKLEVRAEVIPDGDGVSRWLQGIVYNDSYTITVGTDSSLFTAASPHNLQTGSIVKLRTSNGGVLPTPTAGTVDGKTLYYVNCPSASTLRLYTTLADAQGDTNRITFTDNGTASIYMSPGGSPSDGALQISAVRDADAPARKFARVNSSTGNNATASLYTSPDQSLMTATYQTIDGAISALRVAGGLSNAVVFCDDGTYTSDDQTISSVNDVWTYLVPSVSGTVGGFVWNTNGTNRSGIFKLCIRGLKHTNSTGASDTRVLYPAKEFVNYWFDGFDASSTDRHYSGYLAYTSGYLNNPMWMTNGTWSNQHRTTDGMYTPHVRNCTIDGIGEHAVTNPAVFWDCPVNDINVPVGSGFHPDVIEFAGGRENILIGNLAVTNSATQFIDMPSATTYTGPALLRNIGFFNVRAYNSDGIYNWQLTDGPIDHMVMLHCTSDTQVFKVRTGENTTSGEASKDWLIYASLFPEGIIYSTAPHNSDSSGTPPANSTDQTFIDSILTAGENWYIDSTTGDLQGKVSGSSNNEDPKLTNGVPGDASPIIEKVTTKTVPVDASNLARNFSIGTAIGAFAWDQEPVPASPTIGTATATSSSAITVTYTDNAAGTDTSMTLQRATDAGFTTGVTNITVAAGSSSYSDTGLSPGTTYYYQIRASNAAGDSAWSSSANAKTLPQITPTGLNLGVGISL